MVADVGQHLVEEREFGFEGGDGQAGVGHQREQADGLERDRFAAGVGAADQQRAFGSIERQARPARRVLRCGRRMSSSSGWRASAQNQSCGRSSGLRRGTTQLKSTANSALANSSSSLARAPRRWQRFRWRARAGGR